jgi:hypothetical protein
MKDEFSIEVRKDLKRLDKISKEYKKLEKESSKFFFDPQKQLEFLNNRKVLWNSLAKESEAIKQKLSNDKVTMAIVSKEVRKWMNIKDDQVFYKKYLAEPRSLLFTYFISNSEEVLDRAIVINRKNKLIAK